MPPNFMPNAYIVMECGTIRLTASSIRWHEVRDVSLSVRMSAKYIAASERIITEVKWGNAALWDKSFGFFSCILFWHPHKNPVDSLKTSVCPKCEPVAYVMQLHEQNQLFFVFFTHSHPQNVCQDLAVNMWITREAQTYSRYKIELIIHDT